LIYIPTIIACYLIGGIPIGLLVARSRGIDIRTVGSGNIGATNVMRAVGKPLGVMTFLTDVLKGYGPVMLAHHVLGLDGWILGMAAGATVFGHCYSPYLGFTGGKGVATALGIALALNWGAGLSAFGVWAVVTAATKYVSLGSIMGTSSCWIFAWILGEDATTIVTIAEISALSAFQHRANIKRLLNGTEPKAGQGKKTPPAEDEEETPEKDSDE